MMPPGGAKGDGPPRPIRATLSTCALKSYTWWLLYSVPPPSSMEELSSYLRNLGELIKRVPDELADEFTEFLRQMLAQYCPDRGGAIHRLLFHPMVLHPAITTLSIPLEAKTLLEPESVLALSKFHRLTHLSLRIQRRLSDTKPCDVRYRQERNFIQTIWATLSPMPSVRVLILDVYDAKGILAQVPRLFPCLQTLRILTGCGNVRSLKCLIPSPHLSVITVEDPVMISEVCNPAAFLLLKNLPALTDISHKDMGPVLNQLQAAGAHRQLFRLQTVQMERSRDKQLRLLARCFPLLTELSLNGPLVPGKPLDECIPIHCLTNLTNVSFNNVSGSQVATFLYQRASKLKHLSMKKTQDFLSIFNPEALAKGVVFRKLQVLELSHSKLEIFGDIVPSDDSSTSNPVPGRPRYTPETANSYSPLDMQALVLMCPFLQNIKLSGFKPLPISQCSIGALHCLTDALVWWAGDWTMSHLLYLFAQSRAMTRLSLVLQDEEGEKCHLPILSELFSRCSMPMLKSFTCWTTQLPTYKFILEFMSNHPDLQELELTGPRYNNPLTEAEGEEVAMLARMKGVDFRLITAYRSTLFIRPALYVAIG